MALMVIKKYKIEATIETYLSLEDMVKYLEDKTFHTIQVTEVDD